MKKGIVFAAILVITAFLLAGCEQQASSDRIQRQQQERILQEGAAQIGMPAIKNFREKKLLKDIYELRDQTGLVTYTYLWNEMQGKKVFFCQSIGYGIPYATQFTNPQRPIIDSSTYHDTTVIAQADPNGLFSPASAEGTWVMCKDPNGPDVRPVYVEPRIIVSPFKLPE
ncbi:MAG: hypothetical protein ABSB00_00335 [Minisyncoccia bacterium]|jgi:hypothetical protein